MNFVESFIANCQDLLSKLNPADVENVVKELAAVRSREGRLFIVGSGGGAGHASHAACDFRKICNIETYAPYDNVSELTARVNDEGWDTTISHWLKVSRLRREDGLLVFSVGGGSEDKNVSMNLVNAVKYAKSLGATVVGVVGRDGGFTAKEANACVVIPPVEEAMITPLTEGFQAVIWHMLVSHPLLQVNAAKWESLQPVT